jgi:hypothetical protein
VGQAKQHVNQLYKQYSPQIDQTRKEAQRAADTMGGLAGRVINGNPDRRDAGQSVTMKDVERIGQKALWGLGKVGTRVAGGIDRLQQQNQNQGGNTRSN